MTPTFPPQLQPPGAGLPPFHAWLWPRLFPILGTLYTRRDADRLFFGEGRRMLRLASRLSTEQLTQRVLVPPMTGIEDSSRFWSVSMTLEHLIIVGGNVVTMETLLSRGEQPTSKSSIAAVKPEGVLGDGAVREYATFLRRFRNDLRANVRDFDSPTTAPHPWFGPLTMRGWHLLAAVHQSIHRRQIQAIIQRLPRR